MQPHGWFPVDQRIIVLAVFVAAYALIVAFYQRKTIVIWAAVAFLFAAGVLHPAQALRSVEWNVVLLYLGMLVVSDVFLHSRMPEYLATILASRARSVGAAMLLICVFTGVLSMALENVAVVLLVAPVALSIARSCKINPAPLFIGMAISSNLQGAATLIGDPPSMILAQYAGMSFNSFFVWKGRPSIFFAVETGAIISWVVLYFFYRKRRDPAPALSLVRYRSIVPSVLVVALIAALIVASSYAGRFPLVMGTISCIAAVLSIVWWGIDLARSTQESAPVGRRLVQHFKALDWQTALFLIGIFIVVGSLSQSGIMDELARIMLKISGGSELYVYILVVGIAVLLSAFIDNVPFLVAMLPVVGVLAHELAVDPAALLFGLFIGASIGGNITPIGASANIVAMGIAAKEGARSSFFDFVKIGLPFTLAGVLGASLFIWLAVP